MRFYADSDRKFLQVTLVYVSISHVFPIWAPNVTFVVVCSPQMFVSVMEKPHLYEEETCLEKPIIRFY